MNKETISLIYTTDDNYIPYLYVSLTSVKINSSKDYKYDVFVLYARETISLTNINKIKELEAELDHSKVKYHEKLDKEREQSRRSIEYLKKQIDIKDKRIDILMEVVFKRSEE